MNRGVMLIVGTLLATNGFWIYRAWRNGIAPATEEISPVGRLLDSLVPLRGRLEDKPFRLLVFYHAAGDCSCLEDWVNWQTAHRDFSEVLEVTGVFNGTDSQAFLDFTEGMGLDIPLFEDPDRRLRDALGIREGTVVKLLMDRHGSVLLMDSRQYSPFEHEHFLERVRAHIGL